MGISAGNNTSVVSLSHKKISKVRQECPRQSFNDLGENFKVVPILSFAFDIKIGYQE